MIGRADRQPDDQRDSDNRRERETSADAVRALLLLGAHLGFDVRRMDSAMVAAVRSVVDAGAGDADGAANALRAHREMSAAHADGQTGPGLGEIDREAGEDSQAAVEAKVAHRASRQLYASRRQKMIAAARR